MNKYKKTIGLIAGCWLMLSSCAEVTFWNEFLGDQPESSGATTEEMFASRLNAERVLAQSYTNLISGLPTSADNKLGDDILECITDLSYSYRDNISDGPRTLYYNGALSATNIPSHAAYCYGSESDWRTIRYAWLYLENVDKVPDMTAAEKNMRSAEAKVLIALSYFGMLQNVGGVTWLDHAVDVNETMAYPRITFAQTVDNIVALLDDVIDNSNLPWRQSDTDYGRMSKAAAMALKFKVLLFAASPTFNSDTPWHPEADEYTCYGNYSLDRWRVAVEAGREFFDRLNAEGGYALVQPAEETHRARRLAYRQAYFQRTSTEVLISIHKGYGFDGTHPSLFDQRYYYGPTLNYVDMFPWADGSDFLANPDDPSGFDWSNPPTQPFFEVDDAGELVPTRDPRLYENVACPGDMYYNGTTVPAHVNHPNYHLGTGFLMMKYILQQSDDRGTPEQWSHTRLPEIMLGYAEALNEVNPTPTAEAYDMVNQVRARVGLSALPENLSHDNFLKAVLKERALELGFEEVRWYDLIRRGMADEFRKQLYGLTSTGLDDLYNPTQFSFEVTELGDRYWRTTWDTKWYLAPIPQTEINKGYGMTQNPGW